MARTNMAQVEKWAGRSARASASQGDRRTHRFMRAWRGRLVYQWGWFFGIVAVAFFGVQITLFGRPELHILGASMPMYVIFDLMIAIALVIFIMNRAVKTLTYKAALARLDGDLDRTLAVQARVLKKI